MASDTDSGEERRAERKMFICDVCGREYMRKSSFTRHIRSHEETVKPGAKMNRHVKSKKMKLSTEECYCESCQDSILLADLDCHICAPTAAQEPFHCPGCGKFFSQESTLRRHLRLHDKVPKFLYENELHEGSGNDGADGLIGEQSPDIVCSMADLDNTCASASTSSSTPPRVSADVTPSEKSKNISELEESSESVRQSTSAAAGREVPVPVASTSLETETHIPTNPPGKRRTAVRSVKTRILETTTIEPESGLAPVYPMKLFGTSSQPGTNAPIQVCAIDESRRPFTVHTRPPMVAGSASSGEGCTASSKSILPQQTVDNTHLEIPCGETQIAHSSDVSEGSNGPIPATTVSWHHPEPVRREAACVPQSNWGIIPFTSNMGMGQVPFYGIGYGQQHCNSMALTEPVIRSIIPPMYNWPMLLNNQIYPGLYYQNTGPQARVPGVAVHWSMMHQGMMTRTISPGLPSRFFYPC